MKNEIKKIKQEVREHLVDNILKFWIDNTLDEVNGGFIGAINGEGKLLKRANKGAVMNARILWTFSAAYRLLNDEQYLVIAKRAKDEIINKFYDHKNGGIFWSLDYKGEVVDPKKQIYALGFAIYGLSEFHRATGDLESLDYAKNLYYTIERYSLDKVNNGYFEAFAEDWSEINDMRLSEKDANERKTMNTHLHILEPYTNLYKIWPDEGLANSIRNLISIFTDKILDKETNHLGLFFDDNWISKSDIISYGHDIEASWLLYEAACALGDEELIKEVTPITIDIANAAAEGMVGRAGMMYELNLATSHIDADRHWWVQAEAIVGYYNQYLLTKEDSALDKVINTWQFVQDRLVDKASGEWYWSILSDGTTNTTDDKAGFWKCPYHNGRMCIELIEL